MDVAKRIVFSRGEDHLYHAIHKAAWPIEAYFSARSRYRAALTDEAFFSFVSLPTDRLFDHVDCDLGLLETSPRLGQPYHPVYEANQPPFPCRILYCEHYGIYYRIDEAGETVLVFAIEDQRRNPSSRFSTYNYALVQMGARKRPRCIATCRTFA